MLSQERWRICVQSACGATCALVCVSTAFSHRPDTASCRMGSASAPASRDNAREKIQNTGRYAAAPLALRPTVALRGPVPSHVLTEGPFAIAAPAVAVVSKVFADGSRYEGDCVTVDGVMVREGRGVHRFSNGDVYDGTFSRDQMSGQGVFTAASGAVYEVGLPQLGLGVALTCPLASVLPRYLTLVTPTNARHPKGDFSANKFHGKGTYTFPDGSALACGWKNGA